MVVVLFYYTKQLADEKQKFTHSIILSTIGLDGEAPKQKTWHPIRSFSAGAREGLILVLGAAFDETSGPAECLTYNPVADLGL